MSRAAVIRLVALLGGLAALEGAVRIGWITRFTMIPPSEMFAGVWHLFRSGAVFPDLRTTLSGVVIAAIAAVASGFVFGAIIHALPRLRRVLDPVFATYYAIPIFAFYPLFVFMFGLTDFPKIIIAYLYGVVAMIVNTINGLDRIPRVLRKTALVMHLSPVETNLRIVLPFTVPHVFNGIKLAVAYGFIGVISSEFLLSASGLGYQISFAYHEFDNDKLYSTMMLIIILSIIINSSLFYVENVIMSRRARAT